MKRIGFGMLAFAIGTFMLASTATSLMNTGRAGPDARIAIQ